MDAVLDCLCDFGPLLTFIGSCLVIAISIGLASWFEQWSREQPPRDL